MSPSPAAGEGEGAAPAPGQPPHPIRSGDGWGILVAVAISSGITALAWCSYGLFEDPEQGLSILPVAGAIFAITFALGIIVSALLGLPVVYLLTKLGMEGAWSYSLTGALAGGATVFLLFGLPVGSEELPLLLTLGGVPGLLTGAVWWRYHRRHVHQFGVSRG